MTLVFAIRAQSLARQRIKPKRFPHCWRNRNDQKNNMDLIKTMKCNRWTLALAAAGLVTLPSLVRADEQKSESVLTALSTTTISGYVDTSIEWNPGTGNANNPPFAFNGGKQDGFNLNVVKLTIARDADAAESWGAGYKVDLLFGPDANALFTQSSGVPADFAVKQAYIDLHAPVGNGLGAKIGVWDTIIGYEVFEAGNNPNYTRSYGYTVEPTTHTGVLLYYVLSDMFAVNAGIANTFGPTINGRANPPKAESSKTYMGSVTFTIPQDAGFLAGSTVSGGIINGFNGATAGNETSYYLGSTLNTPIAALKLGACLDVLDVHGVGGETWVVGTYASFQATEKLTLSARAEYLRDRGAQQLLLSSTKIFEATATAQYDLWKNVVSRLEVRWDRSLDGSEAFGGTSAGSPDRKNAYLIAANVVYKF
jgi:hypothetical protein